MERALSPDEKIRRAEEMYQRRREQNFRTNQARVNVNGTFKDYTLFKKMALQIIICLLIYFIFYLIKNSNYIFSEEFIKQAKEVLSYDINLTQKYEDFSNWIASFNNENQEEEIIPPEEENVEKVQENKEENVVNQEVEGISSEKENVEAQETQTLSISEDSSSISQSAVDAEEIKSKYSLIKPLEGTITSRFGVRNPTTETVPKYHTGIDIAANTGTVYRAAMAGTVVLVSSEGDYRKTYKNTAR